MNLKKVVLSEYMIIEDSIVIFIIRNDFEQPKVFKISNTVNKVTKLLSSIVDNFINNFEPIVSEWTELTYLLEPYVKPIIQCSNEGDIICMVPHGLIHNIPLHAAKYNEYYFIERNPICYSPSAAIMNFCKQNHSVQNTSSVVFGDPFQDLPYARDEAYIVAKNLDVKPIIGKNVTKDAVLKVLSENKTQPSIIHFACHAFYNENQPLRSGIKLASDKDGEKSDDLNAQDILEIPFRCNLVTISACESGLSKRMEGDELIGLTRSFLSSGASSVLSSLWPVEDLSTRFLMEDFYNNIKNEQMNKVEALQKAQINLMKLSSKSLLNKCRKILKDDIEVFDTEEYGQFKLNIARTLLVAGNITEATKLYHDLRRDGNNHKNYTNNNKFKLLEKRLASFANSSNLKEQHDQMFPFQNPLFWAPFHLTGYWG